MLSNHLGNVLATISDKKIAVMSDAESFIPYFVSNYSLPIHKPETLISKFQSPNSYPAPMTERTAVVTPTDVRYGFNGKEVDSEINGNGNAYDFGARIYDSRLGRWWSVDPEIKTTENPYCGFSNNPMFYIDLDGKDTLVVHAQKMLDNNGSQTVILKITFSLIQNGCEEAQSIDVNIDGKITQRSEVYFTVPASSWTAGNIWIPESGEQELNPIRFEEYQGGSGTEYRNAIRLRYVNKDGVRILAHKGTRGSHSVGCNIPTLTIPEDEGLNFPTSGSQEILDGIRKLYDDCIPSTEGIDEYGRKVQEPQSGYDFMSKSNSNAIESTDNVPTDK